MVNHSLAQSLLRKDFLQEGWMIYREKNLISRADSVGALQCKADVSCSSGAPIISKVLIRVRFGPWMACCYPGLRLWDIYISTIADLSSNRCTVMLF